MRFTPRLLGLSFGLLLLLPIRAHAEEKAIEPLSRAPGANELSLGYGFMPTSKLPLDPGGGTSRPMGLAAEARHLWQVRGLSGGTPAWLGFGTSFLANLGNAERKSFLLDYGVYVRHAFLQGPRVRGFAGYGLGAAQVFVREVKGRGIGHLTLLSLGLDVRLKEKRHMSFELGYRIVMLPSFETETEPARKYNSHGLRLNVGVFFGR